MKKTIIFLIFLSISLNAHAFWIWSPKTKKWKNPRYSAAAEPYLQYKGALALFEEGNFKNAYREFKKFLINYPDSREAADAQYYSGRCLESMDRLYEAFLEYQKVIDSYPNSQRINEIVEREYNIGENFLNRENKKWMGLSFYDFVEHPSIEIFKKIVKKVPYSEYASRAQYKLGIIFMQLTRFSQARDSFQKVIDNYLDSSWYLPAKYQLAIATAKEFLGTDYDSSYLSEATARLDEFIKEHPEAEISEEAKLQLGSLRNKEAKKNLEIAQFYEKQGQYKSSLIYYEKVVSNYSDSDYYEAALSKLTRIKELIKGNITRKEFKKGR